MANPETLSDDLQNDNTPTGSDLIGAERMVFFSDAVVAIAITLLALNLPVPTGPSIADSLRSIGALADDYFAFLVSFVVIAGHWFAHHRVFRYVTGISVTVRNLNMAWLLMIVLTPFAARVLTGATPFQVSFVFYASVQALAAGLFLLMMVIVVRTGALRPGTSADVAGRIDGMAVVLAMFAISIPIAFFTRWAYLCWVLMPWVARLVRLIRSRLARR